MKKLLPTLTHGKFTLIETHAFNDGSGTFETTTTVFDEKADAIKEGNKQATGNTVFVGITEHEVNGKKYFSPGFNVWD